MRRRLALILALVIAMMTAKVVRADQSCDAQQHSLRAEKSSVAIQSLTHRPLFHPEHRNSSRHAGWKGSGLAILCTKLDLFDLSVARCTPAGDRPQRSILPRQFKRARGPPPSSY
jgi:hypothetical protein